MLGCRQRLATDEEVHRGKDPGLAASGEELGRLEQHLVHVNDAVGRDPEEREERDHDMVAVVREPPHLEAVPPGAGGGQREVAVFEHLEPDLLGDVADLLEGA